MTKTLGLMAVVVLLSACNTTYGPASALGGTGGYTDKKVGENQFYIESLTNVSTGPEKALEYWHRRASELCGGRQYTPDVKLQVYRNANYAGLGMTSYHNWPLAVGTATCQ